MSLRPAHLGLVVLAACAGVACGGPEKKVVDQYFSALQQGDDQTLGSFAAVRLAEKVQDWKITTSAPEERQPAPLPELVKKAQEAETALADNKKTYNTYFLDHPKEVEQVRELLKKDAKIPASLGKYAEDWKGFTEKEKELKRQLSDAQDAVEKEKRHVALSLGNREDIETLTGEVVTKKVGLELKIAGEPKAYEMTLKKYDMSPGTQTGRMMSRWVVYTLEPR